MGSTGTAEAPAVRLHFVGQAPQKRSLAGDASCLLPTMVARLARQPCPMRSKYTCQMWLRIWRKTAKKCTKLAVIHQSGTKFGQWDCFSDVLARPFILRGCNIAEFCKQQPIQNSAPNARRLPQKPA